MVLVILFRHKALVVDEMVNGTCLGRIRARKILEIKSFLIELLSTGKAFPIGIQFLQNVMVTRQDAVDSPDHVDLLVRLLVVIAVAARVAAELLVHAPDDRFTAVEAFSFFHSCSVIQLFSCSVASGFWLLAFGSFMTK